MGRSGSGKSSMRSIIFNNYSAYDTKRLGATIDVEHSHLRFLGNMTLNLWDCGGQDVFMDSYLNSKREHIFQMVEVLIHVFDGKSSELLKDVEKFLESLKYLQEFSPDAKVFVLVHKMDLFNEQGRTLIFSELMKHLERASRPYGFKLTGFPTTIWDESLFKAWSQIVCSLIPNMSMFQDHLQKFADVSQAEEVILFERTTFLVVSHVSPFSNQKRLEENGEAEPADSYLGGLDPKRFEKISNIIKTYKQSCSKVRSNLQSLTVHGSNCSVYIDNLTNNTFVMVVMPPGDCDEEGDTIITNIKGSRKWFEQLEEDTSQ